MPRSFVALVLVVGCSPMPELQFNEPPGVPTIVITPAEPTTSDPLVASIGTDAVDAEGDDIAYEWTWYKDGEEVTLSARTVDPSATFKGQVWEVVAVATDGEFSGQEARASVTILNSTPVVDDVEITPTAPTTEDDLELFPSGTDADGDTIVWHIEWTRDNILQPLYTDMTIVPAAATGSLEEWSAEVTPTDGTVEGEPRNIGVYIDNTTPRVGSLRVLPSAPTVDDAIGVTALDVVDPDQPGQTVNIEFVWYVDGVEALRESETDGNSYLADAFAKGNDVTVTATPNDGFASGNPLTSTPVTVANTPPELDLATLTPSSGTESTTFSCDTGSVTDPDYDRVSYDYAWYVDGALISASDQILTGSSFSRGDEIYCVITPDDGDDTGAPVTSDTATVSNTAPSISGVSITPASPTVASSLTASVTDADDDDGDSISYTYAWRVNGVSVGTSSSQLTRTYYERGDEVQVTVTPSDGTASGTARTSTSVEIQNALPSVSSATITPSSAYTDDNLAVSVSGWSDMDDDSAAYRYQWYKNSAAISGETSLTLDESNTVRSDRIYCAVTPDDGYGVGTTRNTSIVTILNSAPGTVADVSTGLTANECDTIEFDASGSTDQDGDTLTYTWSLYSKPTGSNAITADFSSTTATDPTFLVDMAGSFIFNLSANDRSTSVSDAVTVTVYDMAGNVEPVAAPEAEDAHLEQTTGCSSSGSGWVCTPCTGVFNIDAGASYDDDGDPLHLTWSTTSGYASIGSASSESTTVTMRNMPTAHATTYDYQATITLRVQDCAGNVATEDLVLTYACTGN